VAEFSKIAWTTHTFNPWIGCTKVSPGCDHCYAHARDARFGGGVAPHWGTGAPRRRTTQQNWNKPLRWQHERRAAINAGLNPEPVRVFCASLADVFDNEVPDEWRRDLMRLIHKCPDLEWQIVTKRVGNVGAMMVATGVSELPANVILISTVVNQAEADRDLRKLIMLKFADVARYVGVSYEPAVGPVDWRDWVNDIDWIIIGGESDQGAAKARPFDIGWARSTIARCQETLLPVFMKQMGSGHGLKDRAGADPSEWPEDIRVREFPDLGVR
jgi:protein gp37